MSKILTPFENHLKEVMSGYEAQYDANSWNDLQKRIAGKSAGKGVWLVALFATVLVSTAGTVAVYRHRNIPAKAQQSASGDRFSELFALNTRQNSEIGTVENSTLVASDLTEKSIVSSQGNLFGTPSTVISENPTNAAIDPVQAGIIEKSKKTDSAILTTTDENASTSKSSKIQFSSSKREACAGVEVDFQVKGPSKGSYLWNFGDGHYSSEVNPKHKFTKSGNYDVSLSITDDQGHITVNTMQDMVTIHPSPDAMFEWDFVNESPTSPTVKIVNTSEHAVSYEWKFADGSTSNQVSPVKLFEEKGKHTVALEVSNDFGCSDATVKQISVNADFNLNAANGLTIGKELFMPAYLKQNKTSFSLSIYSEDGMKVYETNNRSKGWDGTLLDGTIAQEGSQYLWKVIITSDSTKEEKYFNGTLTINP